MIRLLFPKFNDHCLITLLLIALGVFGTTCFAQTELESNFRGLYADIGIGYREISTSTSSTLSLNGTPIPSTFSAGQPSNFASALTLGYNQGLGKNAFLIGIGANISPGSGQAQQVQVRALNQSIALGGINPLYSYSFFVAPSIQINNGLTYFKVGTQTQVNNSNTGPNFYGYLLGFGYKQLVSESVYLFGEADYGSYRSQTTSKTAISAGHSISANVTTAPRGSRYLFGVGYQF